MLYRGGFPLITDPIFVKVLSLAYIYINIMAGFTLMVKCEAA